MNKLLISTMLKLIYWDGLSPHVFHEGDLGEGTAHYHGMTWDDLGTMYVTGTIQTKYLIHTFDLATLAETGIIHGNLHEPHEAFWDRGRLYVTNTGLNRVEIFEGGNWTYKAWNPSPCDLEHINAIWSDGLSFFIAEHGQKTDRGSIVRICDMDLNQKREILIGPNIHNVYAEKRMLYNLTSPEKGKPAGFVVTNMLNGKQRRIDKPEWGQVLLRGLARTAENWYVGVSRWEENRSERNEGDAIVIQLDNNFEETDRIVLPDYGPVCEVRALDTIDFSHNYIVGHVDG